MTGAVVGGVAGAAIASASKPSTTVVYAAPPAGVYVAPTAPVYVPVPTAPVVISAPVTAPVYTIGTTVTALPLGFTSENVNGVQYYQSGSTWFQMQVGASGVYYQVVPAP